MKKAGQKPYGAYPGEKEVLGQIEFMRLKKMPFKTIAADLTAQSIPTRQGKKWTEMLCRNVYLKLQVKYGEKP